MLPINYDKDIDPHFGSFAPTDADIFIVTVKRKKVNTIAKKKYIVALPTQYRFKDTEIVMKSVLKKFLNEMDYYEFEALDFDSYEGNLEISTLPVVSYDPRNENHFFWLIPPRDMRH